MREVASSSKHQELSPGAAGWLAEYLRARYESYLEAADIRIDGERPWDIRLHDPRLYSRIFLLGSLGLGDSYVDGWWDSDDLEETLARLLNLGVEDTVGYGIRDVLLNAWGRLRNRQSRRRSTIVARRHYDQSSDFYMSFLDPYNQYTCGYFQDGIQDLASAQEAKLDLICRKLQIARGDRVLDIGCGWGGFAKFAAERYGAHVTGITISREQLSYAREFTDGLDVELNLRDYRDMYGEFDRVLVCGMIEHVGHKNYRSLMNVVARCLRSDGLFLLHTIGSNRSQQANDPWIDKHIFPNSVLPSVRQLGRASEGLFVMEDWHNLRVHYVETLRRWAQRFDSNWPKYADALGERTHRIWSYYFRFCAAAFRAGNAQLWQVVFSKSGVPGGYTSIR